MIGAALGYQVKLFLPLSASKERKRILQAYGAELVMTPGDEGTDGAIRRVRELAAKQPERYFYPDQYSNPANWQAHYRGTANEIWEQTGGRVTHFVRRWGPADVCWHDAAVEGIESSDSLHQPAWRALEHLEGSTASAGLPRNLRRCSGDENLEVSTEETPHGEATGAGRRPAVSPARPRPGTAAWKSRARFQRRTGGAGAVLPILRPST